MTHRSGLSEQPGGVAAPPCYKHPLYSENCFQICWQTTFWTQNFFKLFQYFCWLPCNRLQYQNVSTQSVAGLVFNHWLAWRVRWWNLCPHFKLVLVWLLSCALSLRRVPWRRHVQHVTGTSTQSKLHSLTDHPLPFITQINLDSHWVSFASYTQPSNLSNVVLHQFNFCENETETFLSEMWWRLENKLKSSVFSLIITILACQNQVH